MGLRDTAHGASRSEGQGGLRPGGNSVDFMTTWERVRDHLRVEGHTENRCTEQAAPAIYLGTTRVGGKKKQEFATVVSNRDPIGN